MITIATLINVLIKLLVAGLIAGAIIWAIDYIGIPQPFNKGCKVVIVIIAILYLIAVLLPLI